MSMFDPNAKLFMLDIETDGLSPSVNRITEIGIQPFTFRDIPDCTKKTHVNMHLDCAELIHKRADLETLKWREEHKPKVIAPTLKTQRFPEFHSAILGVFKSFGVKNCHVIANHPEFDIAYLRSYCDSFGLEPFWHYGNVWDMGSLIAGLGFEKVDIKKNVLRSDFWQKNILDVYFDGKDAAHNAHYDCVLQIEMLRCSIELLRN